jgi:hypothetical protein
LLISTPFYLLFIKNFNQDIEIPVVKIINHLKENLIEKNNSKNLKIIPSNNSLEIRLDSKLHGIKFNWTFNLQQLDSKKVKDCLVLPLLFNLAEYQTREAELLKIINNKDKEIEDYKLQNVPLTRSLCLILFY